MNVSNSIDEEDTSSSELKWDSMSITSVQSGLTRFDTIEDVSHAIGKYERQAANFPIQTFFEKVQPLLRV